MDAKPLAMGNLARQWDEQHLDLESAAGQIGGAPTGGFTPGVSGAASRFSSTWKRFATDLGAANAQFAYAGDSPNDAPMFAFFANSIGVANVVRFAGHMAALPKYVARAAAGAGFAEIAAHLLGSGTEGAGR